MSNEKRSNEDRRVAFLDGKIVAEEDAKVSISDFGVRRGDAAFDSVANVSRKAFQAEGTSRPTLPQRALCAYRAATVANRD